jgi:hypothetical protein
LPATVLPFRSCREGLYIVLEAVPHGQKPRNIGVLLRDPATGKPWIRMLPVYDFAEPEHAEVREALEEEIRRHAFEMGAIAFLDWLEDRFSNVRRGSDRQTAAVDSFTRVVERLYSEHVEPVRVGKYTTHLPRYTLRAALGRLGDEMESLEEDWVPAPEGVRLGPDLFVAHVVGRSIEPRIPDGGGMLDETARYTPKRYQSKKSEDKKTGEWAHERLRLEPSNPKFEPWAVEPNDFAVVAEWLRVID